MPKPFDLVFWGLFFAIIVATLLALWLTRILRERHPETCQVLGLDTWWRENSGSGEIGNDAEMVDYRGNARAPHPIAFPWRRLCRGPCRCQARLRAGEGGLRDSRESQGTHGGA